jgi:hypothetical protein
MAPASGCIRRGEDRERDRVASRSSGARNAMERGKPRVSRGRAVSGRIRRPGRHGACRPAGALPQGRSGGRHNARGPALPDRGHASVPHAGSADHADADDRAAPLPPGSAPDHPDRRPERVATLGWAGPIPDSGRAAARRPGTGDLPVGTPASCHSTGSSRARRGASAARECWTARAFARRQTTGPSPQTWSLAARPRRRGRGSSGGARPDSAGRRPRQEAAPATPPHRRRPEGRGTWCGKVSPSGSGKRLMPATVASPVVACTSADRPAGSPA